MSSDLHPLQREGVLTHTQWNLVVGHLANDKPEGGGGTRENSPVYYLIGHLPDPADVQGTGAERVRAVLANPAVWNRAIGQWTPDPADVELTGGIVAPKITENTRILLDGSGQQFGFKYDLVEVNPDGPLDLDEATFTDANYGRTLAELYIAGILQEETEAAQTAEAIGLGLYLEFVNRVSSKTVYDAVLQEDLTYATGYADSHIMINGQSVHGYVYGGDLFTGGTIANGTHLSATFDPQARKFYMTGAPCLPAES